VRFTASKKLLEGRTKSLWKANAPCCQRADRKRVTTGKATNYRKFTEEEVTPLPPSVLEAAKAEGVRAAAEFARA
jgi:hypothetical protein